MNLEALIAARPRRRSELATWYPQLLAAADHEQVPIASLAARLGCSAANLYRWRKHDSAGEPRRPRLVRATVAPEPKSITNRLEIRTRNGRSVMVPDVFDPKVLAAIVAVLEAC